MPHRAIFLDRDGVINVNRDDYVKSWDEFQFLPNSLAALRLLSSLPVPLIVVTNQSVVGRGIITRAQLDEIHRRMLEVIKQNDARIDAIYVCPHAPWENCSCRKPRPGLLLQAQRDFDLDLSASFLIGDRPSDIQAARAVGVIPILIPAPDLPTPYPPAAYQATDLLDAARWLASHLRDRLYRPEAN